MFDHVFTNHRNQGSGGVYLVSGTDFEAVRAKAKAIKDDIDYMRSPCMTESVQNTGELLVEIKYYGLD